MKGYDQLNKQVQWAIAVGIGENINTVGRDIQKAVEELGGMDVKFTVNGIELDVENIWKRIDEQFDLEVERRAKELAISRAVKKYEVESALWTIKTDVDNLVDIINNNLDRLNNGFKEEDW